MHEVSGGHSDSNTLSIALIERLVNTATIIHEKSTVLHKFNTAFFKGRATLSTVIHDCHLGLSLGIANSNG
jgi:hypothetical protein